MPKQRQDLTARRFGRLVAIRETRVVRRRGQSDVYWACRCDCGNETETRSANLKSGATKSCGCLQKERTGNSRRTHGMRRTPEYMAWTDMKTRCGNPNDKGFVNYGARGIQCKFKTFEEFFEDVGRRPSKNHSIDRIENNGHYEPGNVRWVRRAAQNRNRRNTLTLCYMGSDRPLGEWAEIFGVSYHMLHKRIKRGWTPEEILFGRK